jgi:hypothetical protein
MSRPDEKKLSELERLLAALPPRPTSLDRDNLLFRAGQESMKRSWIWPLVAVTMSVATGCLAMVLVLRPAPEPIVRIVHVEASAPASRHAAPRPPDPNVPPVYPEQAPPSALSYWRMQQQALRFGVEGLPLPAADGNDFPESGAAHERDYSAGSRPRVTDPSSSFLWFGER